MNSTDYRAQAQILVESEELGVEATNEGYDEKFLQFMEANAGLDMDLLSDEALKLQANFMARGTHPFDVLKRIVANPFCAPRDRISASKTLLEYSARKIPAQLEVTGKNGAAVKIDQKMLSALSDEELSLLDTLLSKASKGV